MWLGGMQIQEKTIMFAFILIKRIFFFFKIRGTFVFSLWDTFGWAQKDFKCFLPLRFSDLDHHVFVIFEMLELV